jgi:hypothetical protein
MVWGKVRLDQRLLSSPLKNIHSRRSRGNETQISSENRLYSEPPYVGSYFLNGLLGIPLAGRSALVLTQKIGVVARPRAFILEV